MSLAGMPLSGVLIHTVADLVVDSLASCRPAIDERNVKQDVVEFRLGNGRPNRASHSIQDSFSSQSLAEASKNGFVIQRLRQALLTLLDGKSVAIMPVSEPFFLKAIERIHRLAK